jgi:putative glycosyltransferase (TIGR04348 family)
LAKPHVVIISPASAKANNGNWQTASRWARFLAGQYHVAVMPSWNGEPCDLLIALHARRSAAPLAAFAATHPERPTALVLTGTDLYRDIRTDADAQTSLRLATRLIVLQEAGLHALPPSAYDKTGVIHQSAPSLTPAVHAPAARYRDVTMIGHLRDEKDPLTFMRAAALATAPRLRMLHIGGALDPALEQQARAMQQTVPHYHWLGNLPHAATRQRLKRSRLMVIASRMEGGANVIIEAVTSGVPVLASDISGNRGMLGDDYAGYFPVGDYRALAAAIDRVLEQPAFEERLRRQCNARAPLFAPARERAAVLRLAAGLLAPR